MKTEPAMPWVTFWVVLLASNVTYASDIELKLEPPHLIEDDTKRGADFASISNYDALSMIAPAIRYEIAQDSDSQRLSISLVTPNGESCTTFYRNYLVGSEIFTRESRVCEPVYKDELLLCHSSCSLNLGRGGYHLRVTVDGYTQVFPMHIEVPGKLVAKYTVTHKNTARLVIGVVATLLGVGIAAAGAVANPSEPPVVPMIAGGVLLCVGVPLWLLGRGPVEKRLTLELVEDPG